MGTCFHKKKTSKALVCEAGLVSIPFLMSTVNAVETEVSYHTQVCMFTLVFVLILKVRAQLVQQQQQQAAAAVQAAQAQAAQMGASGQVRAQGPVSQVTGLWQVHARDEHGDGFLAVPDEGSDMGHPLDRGDMVSSAVSPLPGVRGRISVSTSLCMFSVPSRCECCLY